MFPLFPFLPLHQVHWDGNKMGTQESYSNVELSIIHIQLSKETKYLHTNIFEI